MKKRTYSVIIAVLLAVTVFVLPIVNPGKNTDSENNSNINRASSIIQLNRQKDNKPAAKVNIPKSDASVTFIVTVDGDSLADTVLKSNNRYENVRQLLDSDESRKYIDNIKKSQAIVKANIEKLISGADFKNCYTYNTVINGFSVNSPFSAMDKIRKISGVTSVFPVFNKDMIVSEYEWEDEEYYDEEYYDDPYEETYEDIDTQTDEEYAEEYDYEYEDPEIYDDEDPDTEESNENSTDENEESGTSEESSNHTPVYQQMIHADNAHEKGYTGNGKVIAFIDNAFDPSAKAFQAAPSSLSYTADEIKKLTSQSSFNIVSNASVTKSDKVIYAYDYADQDDDTYSSYSFHGTYTAAAAAGCFEEDENNYFHGTAYDAQLIFMKVCKDESNYANEDSLLAALDDTAKLSPDILNISLGSGADSQLLTNALDLLNKTGTLICASAGNNSQNIYTPDKNGISAEYTDYGTISYPSSLPYVISAASEDSTENIYNYFETEDGKKIPYCDFVSSGETDIPSFSNENNDTDYLYADITGTKNDYADLNVKDKIIILKRGEISFEDKIKYASIAGAAGLIVISDEPLYTRFTADESVIPCACIGADAETYLKEHPSGKITFQKNGTFTDKNGGKPSSFTSYGVTSDLRLKPDLAAPGTELLLPDENGYEKFTGTSASSAVTAGAAAVVSQYINKNHASIAAPERITAISALMMNTAVPARYNDKLYYTPRLQGAGNLNLQNILTSLVYITDENGMASISLGDSETGEYSYSLILHNFTDKEQTYELSGALQSDKLSSINGKIYNTLTPEDISSSASVTFSVNNKEVRSVTVKAQENLTLDCKIRLKPELLYYYQLYAKSGMYIDGFVFFTPKESDSVLSVPFMGYCGIWSDAEIFDSSIYNSTEEPALGASSLNACIIDNGSIDSTPLGFNHFTGKADAGTICAGKNTVKNAHDLTGETSSFILPNYYLLRDTTEYTIIISDSSDKNVFELNIGKISNLAKIGTEPYVELINRFNTDNLQYLFSQLSEGTYKYTVNASAVDSTGGTGETKSLSYEFTVDNTAPEMPETEIYSENDRLYLKLTAKDNTAIQGFILYTAGMTDNTLNYSDRIDELIENEYISDDAYTLITSRFHDNSAEFVYDITYLYRDLMRLKTYAQSNNMNIPVPQTIFVKSVDSAFNLSDPVQCTSAAPGKVVYSVKDQNNRPVEGMEVTLSGITLKSDSKGIIEFTDIIPDTYAAHISYLPENYKAEKTTQLVEITNSNYELNYDIRLKYTGKELYAQDESSAETEEMSVKEETEAPQEDNRSFDVEDSAFALIFISVMLIISTVSLLISRRKKYTGNL